MRLSPCRRQAMSTPEQRLFMAKKMGLSVEAGGRGPVGALPPRRVVAACLLLGLPSFEGYVRACGQDQAVAFVQILLRFCQRLHPDMTVYLEVQEPDLRLAHPLLAELEAWFSANARRVTRIAWNPESSDGLRELQDSVNMVLTDEAVTHLVVAGMAVSRDVDEPAIAVVATLPPAISKINKPGTLLIAEDCLPAYRVISEAGRRWSGAFLVGMADQPVQTRIDALFLVRNLVNRVIEPTMDEERDLQAVVTQALRNVEWTCTPAGGPRVPLNASVEKLDFAVQYARGAKGWVATGGRGAVPTIGQDSDKYRDLLQSIGRDILSGKALRSPWTWPGIVVDAGGGANSASIRDGRHQFAVWRDLGVPTIMACVKPSEIEKLRFLSEI